MKLTEREKLWIQRDEETNSLTISGEWFDMYSSKSPDKLTKTEAIELFECIKSAIHTKYPNLVINPWSDAETGTLD